MLTIRSVGAALADGWKLRTRHPPGVKRYGYELARVGPAGTIYWRGGEIAQSRTCWRLQGFDVLPDQTPEKVLNHCYAGQYAIYRRDQVERSRRP